MIRVAEYLGNHSAFRRAPLGLSGICMAGASGGARKSPPLEQHLIALSGKPIQTCTLRNIAAETDIMLSLKDGTVVALDFSWGFTGVDSTHLVGRYTALNWSFLNFTNRLERLIPCYDEYGRRMFETLKNAFVHDNKLNPNRKIYLRLDMISQYRQVWEVYDTAVRKPLTVEQRNLAEAACLCGERSGFFVIGPGASRRNVYVDGKWVGTRAHVKVPMLDF